MYHQYHAEDQDNDTDMNSVSNLFNEPPDYNPPSPPPKKETYTLLSGHKVNITLVGHSPLWGHHLWNAGRIISDYLQTNSELVRERSVLELGAGAGLPSLVCAYLGADCVVVTDYPDINLVENLKQNVKRYNDEVDRDKFGVNSRLVVEGYCWGADCQSLLSHLSPQAEQTTKFDILLMADLLFNHSEHAKLLATVQKTLKKHDDAQAFVFFTPYRPWLLSRDLAFFDLAQESGMVVHKILEKKMDKVMFEEDCGDQELRKTVFGYTIKWKL